MQVMYHTSAVVSLAMHIFHILHPISNSPSDITVDGGRGGGVIKRNTGKNLNKVNKI